MPREAGYLSLSGSWGALQARSGDEKLLAMGSRPNPPAECARALLFCGVDQHGPVRAGTPEPAGELRVGTRLGTIPRMPIPSKRRRCAQLSEGVRVIWSHPPGLNRRPADYESAALPAELGWPVRFQYNIGRRLRTQLGSYRMRGWTQELPSLKDRAAAGLRASRSPRRGDSWEDGF